MELSSPRSLYGLATGAIIQDFSRLQQGLDGCPENVLFDVIFEIFSRAEFRLLAAQVSHFPTFSKLLKMGSRRGCLHKMVQSASEQDRTITETISQEFSMGASRLLQKLPKGDLTVTSVARTIETGFTLGGFLCEAGWYPAATTVHRAGVSMMRRLGQSDPSFLCCQLESLSKLLHSLSSYCCFPEASDLAAELLDLLDRKSVV